MDPLKSTAAAAFVGDRMVPILQRLALAFTLLVVIALPGGFFSLNYSSLVYHTENLAKVKAGAINAVIGATPDLWMYQLQRLEELLLRSPPALTDERATIYDAAGDAVLAMGAVPEAPVLIRSAPIYDSGRLLGRVEIAQPYREVVLGTLVAGLLGLAFGAMVYFALLVLPLRALRRISAALDHESAALRAAEEQFRGLVEQSIAGIFIVQDEKLAYVNPRFAEIGGFRTADSLIGRDPMPLIAEKDRSKVMENSRRLLAGEIPGINYEFTAHHNDGTVIEVGVHATRASYLGRPAMIGMMQDISEKTRAEEKIRQYISQLKTAFMSTVDVATRLSEMRDPYTAGHERRVAEIAVAIGAELGFDKDRLDGLRVAGALHDVGKITIPAEILSKPGKLSPIEFQLLQGHTQSGYDVLKEVAFPWPVAEIALQHHERMDGSGYPQGLKGDAILLEARIMAVADVLEAMSAHRPYRPGRGVEAALAELERGRATEYDADAVDACLRLFRDRQHPLPA